MSKKRSSEAIKSPNRYGGILVDIFRKHFRRGVTAFEFERSEIEVAATNLAIPLPKNIGDLIYSFRFRSQMPPEIISAAPSGLAWVIELAGHGKYRFSLQKPNLIVPTDGRAEIKIPDSTPQIVIANALGDEQALLAKVRYNRMIDIFLRVTAYSLQNHLRTTVPLMGQIETDEVYVAVRNTGQQFVVPVQAKGGKDKIGIVQIKQDLALCKKKFPNLTPRPVAVQFKIDDKGEVIVMFELTEIEGEIKLVDEKHYRLVSSSEISADDLSRMSIQD